MDCGLIVQPTRNLAGHSFHDLSSTGRIMKFRIGEPVSEWPELLRHIFHSRVKRAASRIPCQNPKRWQMFIWLFRTFLSWLPHSSNQLCENGSLPEGFGSVACEREHTLYY